MSKIIPRQGGTHIVYSYTAAGSHNKVYSILFYYPIGIFVKYYSLLAK